MGVKLIGNFKSLQLTKMGVPVPAFTSSIPSDNLTLHLDASNTDSLSLGAGNTIVQWDDLSGNNNHATPLNANSPTWSASAFPGSQPGITFSSNNSNALTGDDANFALGSNTRTLFLIAYPTNASTQSMFMQGDNSGASNRWDIRTDDDAIRIDIAFATGNWSTFAGPNTAKLITVAYPGGALQNTEVTVNGVVGTTGNTSTVPATNDNAYYIGARIDGFFYDGVISEVAYYNSLLTNTQIDEIQTTLKNKWGI